MTDLLGEPLDDALEQLAARGLMDVRVTETVPPRGGHDQGTLRVVRITDDGRELLAARFPDEVKP